MSHSWLVLSVLTGTFFGIQSILLKILSQHFEQTTILKTLFLVAGFLLLPAIFIASPNLRPIPFFLSFAVSITLNIVAYTLLLKAIVQYPVSIVMPFVGLTPLFLTITSFLILGETITSIKIIGILFIVFGGFILQLPQDISLRNVKNHGFKDLINTGEKGIWYMVLVAFLWSITASVEKIAVRASSPEFYGASIHLSLGAAFLVIQKFSKKKNGRSGGLLPSVTKKSIFLLLLIGVVSAALAWCQLTAIKITYVTYVITFKRAGILVSTLLAFLILKERNYAKAISGTVSILIGAALITIF
ncbi:MAG: EamA family transporter [Calditrichaeota bacterium]|nr:EamA family transporter [Calditrichota bacterium]